MDRCVTIVRHSNEAKQQLWGREFWSDGYFASTVGKHVGERMIAQYVKNQGNDYLQFHLKQYIPTLDEVQ